MIESSGGEDTDSLREIFEFKAVPVNRAGEQLLITVPGIGPELARRIVEQRNRSGRFNAPDELTKVSGIGPRRVEQFKQHLSFD